MGNRIGGTVYLNFNSPDQVVSELKAQANGEAPIWLLCVADSHEASLPALIDSCREAGLRVFGGVFPGLIHGRKVEKTGIVAIPYPAESHLAIADLDHDRVDWRIAPPEQSGDAPASAVLLIDCLAANISGLMDDLYNRYATQVVYYGAGTGYHDLHPGAALFTEHGPLQHAAVMLVTPQRTTVRVRHGWKRVSGPFVASRTSGNVIQEINWEPASAYYRQQVAEQDAAYADRPIFPDISAVFPLCIAKEGGEDVVRDPIMQTADGEIVVLSDVGENSVMYLAHGDHDMLIEAASEAMRDCGEPDDVAHCFLSDCFSRVLKLGDTFEDELDAATTALKKFSDVTPDGVLALGEVANNGGRYLELFNKTFVVALTHL